MTYPSNSSYSYYKAYLCDFQEVPKDSHFQELHLVMVSRNRLKFQALHIKMLNPDGFLPLLQFWGALG